MVPMFSWGPDFPPIGLGRISAPRDAAGDEREERMARGAGFSRDHCITRLGGIKLDANVSGQIKVAFWKGNGTPYFREI